jgi:hypothetical protein
LLMALKSKESPPEERVDPGLAIITLLWQLTSRQEELIHKIREGLKLLETGLF